MRILLVEDEPKMSRFIEKGLRRERFAVDPAIDGETALYSMVSTDYDLVILDLMLPGRLSGTDVLQRIRTKNQNVPILILTARNAVGEKVTHLSAGADDYLTKPFELAELAIRIRVLLRRGPLNHSDTIKVADLEMNRVSREVRRDTQEIPLTAKEYSLLEFMMVNAGRVLSRDLILEHVWDQSFEGLGNIVDVYIRRLRSKIDDSFKRQLIHTAYSIGYCLSDKKSQ
jgi:DNA-binding response OmpR family regulator